MQGHCRRNVRQADTAALQSSLLMAPAVASTTTAEAAAAACATRSDDEEFERYRGNRRRRRRRRMLIHDQYDRSNYNRQFTFSTDAEAAAVAGQNCPKCLHTDNCQRFEFYP